MHIFVHRMGIFHTSFRLTPLFSPELSTGSVSMCLLFLHLGAGTGNPLPCVCFMSKYDVSNCSSEMRFSV